MSPIKTLTLVYSTIIQTLTLTFMFLKIADQIDWSWWWVFSPAIFNLALLFIIVIAGFIVGYTGVLREKNKSTEPTDLAETIKKIREINNDRR